MLDSFSLATLVACGQLHLSGFSLSRRGYACLTHSNAA